MFREVGLVILGSGLGGGMRHLIGLWLPQATPADWPWATLLVNVIGSFLIGWLAVWLTHSSQAEWRWLLISGLLGGFTTYSAYSLQLLQLLQSGETGRALAYLGITLLLALAAVWAGALLGRQSFG